MQKNMRKLGAVLIAAVITAGVGIWVPLASAGAREVKPKAPVSETGQTQCWDEGGLPISCMGTGQDGDIQAGVPFPSPRFTDNGNGTVRDNLTGLIWLKDANCFGEQGWANALWAAQQLAVPQCDLTDGSVTSDWRLPNVRELQSLIDFDRHLPALPTGHPFVGVLATRYWSSTTAASATEAWTIDLGTGGTFPFDKPSNPVLGPHVWPVRGRE